MMDLLLKLCTATVALMLVLVAVAACMETAHGFGLVTLSDSARLTPWYALGWLMVLNCVLMAASLCKLVWDMWAGRDT